MVRDVVQSGVKGGRSVHPWFSLDFGAKMKKHRARCLNFVIMNTTNVLGVYGLSNRSYMSKVKVIELKIEITKCK